MYESISTVSAYGLFTFGVFLLLLALFAPAVIAAMRGHPNATPILLVLVFFGWTFLGWFIALVWSFSAISEDRSIVVKNYNGRSRRYEDDEEDELTPRRKRTIKTRYRKGA